jgi:2-polyprenyl-6-methoxyphenol hydroxylase-like FAD-dependent oxidoreductase
MGIAEADFDVAVVGAGPAGSTCALFLARQGVRVLLLDKQVFPRDKVCADNKTWKCLDIVRELGLWGEFEKLPKAHIRGVLVASPSGRTTRARSAIADDSTISYRSSNRSSRIGGSTFSWHSKSGRSWEPSDMRHIRSFPRMISPKTTPG